MATTRIKWELIKSEVNTGGHEIQVHKSNQGVNGATIHRIRGGPFDDSFMVSRDGKLLGERASLGSARKLAER